MFTQPYNTTLHPILKPLLEVYPEYTTLDFQVMYYSTPTKQLVLFNRFLHQIEREPVEGIDPDRVQKLLQKGYIEFCNFDRSITVNVGKSNACYVINIVNNPYIEDTLTEDVYFDHFCQLLNDYLIMV